MDVDKNRAQQQKERDGRRVIKIAEELVAASAYRRMHLNKPDGLVSMAGKPLLHLVPSAVDKICTLKWNEAVASEFKINCKEIRGKFKERFVVDISTISWAG